MESEKPDKTKDNQYPDTLQAKPKATISDGITGTKLQHIEEGRNEYPIGVIDTENEESDTNGPIGTKLQNVDDGRIDGPQIDVLCGREEDSTRCHIRQNLLEDTAASNDTVHGPTRKHTEDISTVSSSSLEPEITPHIIAEMCPSHPDRVIEYFCHTDSVLGCTICMDLNHCLCRVDFISESSKKLGNSNEVSKIMEQLSDFAKDLVSAKVEVSEKVKIVHDCKHKATQDIARFRKEMDVFLGRLEENAVNKAQAIEDECLRKLQILREETDTLVKMVEIMKADIDTVNSTGCNTQLYIKLKKTNQDVENMHVRLEKVKARSHVTNHVFKPGNIFEDLILKAKELGDFLKTEPELAEFGSMFVENLNIKDYSMPELYYSSTTFTGIEVLPPDKLIITGWSANTTFLLDASSGKINARIEAPSPPWDVTSVGANQVAITVPKAKMIQFVAIKDEDDTLHAYRDMNVDGECFGVVCTGDALVVTVPGQIQVMNMTGVKLRTITKGAFGAHFSDKSLCIALDLDKKSVYVSDGKHNAVSRISLTGEVLGFYMSGTLVQPAGLTVDKHGLVFVCGKKSNNVHCLTQDLSEGRVLLSENDDDIVGPGCIAYCSRTHSLYLGRQYRLEKKIKVFKLLR